ncbi:MAG: arsenate reductase [Onishia taeanensis]|uniref:arsenate reductase n=1 Tax=Halomonadaceae TaxID=28256 RepID=UPI0027154995|nr:arsenate reductase [Halomonas sp. I5-271120]
MITLYGIKACDTCRKARKALEAQGLPFKVHDLRDDGLSAALLDHLLERVPLMTLLNKRSTTWRQLSDADKDGLDATSARALMMEHPTLLKRPLLDTGERIRVGYRDGDYDKLTAIN